MKRNLNFSIYANNIFNQELKEKKIEMQNSEKRLIQREENLDRKMDSLDKKERVLQALLFQWYRHKIALKNDIANFKPVILFRSKYADVNLPENSFDDYKNGIDNVIIDKETGGVVCTFDEVNDLAGGSRHDKKMEKIKKKALQGGYSIKYGYTFITDETTSKRRLIQKETNNVPTFYLALSNDELKKLISSMHDTSTISETEREVYEKLIKSLEEQVEFLLKQKLPQKIRENLIVFSVSLNSMKDRIKQKNAA